MIAAIVLAAGESKRMGQPKMLMAWGQTTVIGRVISTLIEAGVGTILVVTGEIHDKLSEEADRRVRYIQNKDYATGEMLCSVKVGLTNLDLDQEAALIVLGDQPQIQGDTVKSIIQQYERTRHPIIVPSYRFHRGHPWLVDRSYWKDILTLEDPSTLRDFLNEHNDKIDYIEVETPSIMSDIDTIADYEQFKP